MKASKPAEKIISLRLPPDLREWLEQRAKRQERSLNYTVTNMIKQAKADQEARS